MNRIRPKRPILRAMLNPGSPSPFGPMQPQRPLDFTFTIDPFSGQPVRPGSLSGNVCPPGQALVNGRCVSAACPEAAPYVCTGFPGECSAYPSDHPLHGIDCKSYTTPYFPGVGVAGAGMRQANPDCSSANTPASQCKWICLPMPTPNDPHDMHCARIPIEAQLSGAFLTSSPGAARSDQFRAARSRPGLFQRLAMRMRGQ